jgi:capsular exopolysaccharide synthesis family protein
MNRVEEALRRARQEASGLADHPVTPGGASDIDTLASEPFPVEMSAHRPARSRAVAIASRADGPRTTSGADSVIAPRPEVREAVLPALPRNGTAGRLVTDPEILPAAKEQYRRVAAALHHAQTATGVNVVMVASAAPAEGKTLTAANLALTFAESYARRVLLIDADLRNPSLNRIFGVESQGGLSELLVLAGKTLRAVPVTPRLSVLSAGRPSADPMAGLTSARMRKVLEEARADYDWVILDTPPIALLPDANLVAQMVDVAVLVVRAGATPYRLVQRAIELIGRQRIAGVVLNGAATTLSGEYGQYHGYGYGGAGKSQY